MTLVEVKKEFYALRNGIIADTMRKAGAPYRMVFGLNLPQLTQLARTIGADQKLAEELRADTAVRESQLLAPMLYTPSALSEDDAEQWVRSCPGTEAIDVLCLKLLRHEPYAHALVERMANDENELIRYAALRLAFNTLSGNVAAYRLMAEQELSRECGFTRHIAVAMIAECDALTELQQDIAD